MLPELPQDKLSKLYRMIAITCADLLCLTKL